MFSRVSVYLLACLSVNNITKNNITDQNCTKFNDCLNRDQSIGL